MDLTQWTQLRIGPRLCARFLAAGLPPDNAIVDELLRSHGTYAKTVPPRVAPITHSWPVLPDGRAIEIITETRLLADEREQFLTIMGLASEWSALVGEPAPRPPSSPT